MTYEDAEPWWKRLCRIWLPGHDSLSTQMGFILDEHDVYFFAWFESRLCWSGVIQEWDQYRRLTLSLTQYSEADPGHILHSLTCNDMDGELRIDFGGSSTNHVFLDRWLNWFRRNCWLCGCTLEASATEKTEWLQSFDRVDVESWRLAF